MRHPHDPCTFEALDYHKELHSYACAYCEHHIKYGSLVKTGHIGDAQPLCCPTTILPGRTVSSADHAAVGAGTSSHRRWFTEDTR